jgi:hypothetical protein
MRLGLREYGPVLFPAYTGAEILGVRMQLPEAPDDAPGSTELEEYGSDEEETVTGGAPEAATSARSHQHQLYLLNSKERRERIGLTW